MGGSSSQDVTFTIWHLGDEAGGLGSKPSPGSLAAVGWALIFAGEMYLVNIACDFLL